MTTTANTGKRNGQDAPMINGAHAILYSHDADTTRATLAKVLGPGRLMRAAAG